MLEERATDDRVASGTELEQERLASLEDAKPPTPILRSPDVDLVHWAVTGERSQVFEPSPVGDRDVLFQPSDLPVKSHARDHRFGAQARRLGRCPRWLRGSGGRPSLETRRANVRNR